MTSWPPSDDAPDPRANPSTPDDSHACEALLAPLIARALGVGPSLAPGQCSVCGCSSMLSRVTLGDTMALVCLGCLSCEGPQPLRMPARFLAMLAMPVPKFEVREPAPVPALSVCPTCGVTFADVTASGLLGCPGCYTAFAEAVEFGLARLHGSS